VRFLSIEPLLGPIGKIDLEGIHWVIVGGESGPRAPPMLVEWSLSLIRGRNMSFYLWKTGFGLLRLRML
jgi:protein gp37